MGGQYSHKQFFRRVPNALLADYFETKQIDFDIDFSTLREKEIDALFDVFTLLSPALQATIEAEFQDINAMACEGGVAALIDEAGFHEDDTFVGAVAAIEGFHAKAIWAFLHKPTYWRGAAMFLHADNVSASYWKKRNDLPLVPPNVEDAAIDKLAQAISKFFYSKEGRGKNCKVEPYSVHFAHNYFWFLN